MKFRLADHSCDAALRGLMRESVMPGHIRIAFCREPDFFHGLGVQGKRNQVVVALNGVTVVGMGCRSIKPVFLRGEVADFGYLSGLRLLPRFHGSLALARSYAFTKELHGDGAVPAYLTTIVEGNVEATRLLTSGRAGLPRYADYGRYLTYAINVEEGERRCRAPEGITIERGSNTSLARIVGFLRENSRRRQFFPALTMEDFGTAYLRGIKAADFHIAFSGNTIVGVAAVWDQRGFKQNLLCGYSGMISMAKPILDTLLRLIGQSTLPTAGTNLELSYISFISIRDDEQAVLRALLNSMRRDVRERGCRLMLIGFHERDPLLPAIRSLSAIRYASRVFIVGWDGLDELVRTLDSNVAPHLELATL